MSNNIWRLFESKCEPISSNNKIGFIKIDVEGHEQNVLIGGQALIKENKPVMVIEIEERHTKKPIKDTINFIKNLNYDCYYLSGDNMINIDEIYPKNPENNFIFLPKKIWQKFL